jgi:hypothetical protein
MGGGTDGFKVGDQITSNLVFEKTIGKKTRQANCSVGLHVLP